MNAILDTKPESAYDDDIASRYHFPARHLGLTRRCVEDWVVFRRPRAGGDGIAHFAVGRVAGITPDPTTPGHHYAAIADLLAFDRPVPCRVDGRYAEAALREIINVPQVGSFSAGSPSAGWRRPTHRERLGSVWPGVPLPRRSLGFRRHVRVCTDVQAMRVEWRSSYQQTQTT